MINPNGQAILAGLGGDALPAGFSQAHSAADETPAFDLQLAQHGFSAAVEAMPEASPAMAEHAGKAPADTAEPDAEQWLLSMLDQQAVRVAAREGAAHPSEEAETATQPADAEVSELPLLASVSNSEERQVDAAVTMRQALPAVAGAVQALPMTRPVAEAPQMPNPLATSNVEGALDSALLERLPATSSEADASVPTTATHTQPSAQPQAAERTLKLHAPQAQWGEQMLASLRENVELQINQRIQNATIRLDPPELGSLEILLSHESGRLSVQLSAANADVARLLQQTSDRLRQELVGQNFVQVNVQVSADAQGGRQQHQAQPQAWLAEETVAAAAVLPKGGERNATESTSDVLVTV